MTQRIRRFLAFLYCVLLTLSLLGCASQARVDAPSLLSEVTLQSLHERYPKAFTAKVCVLPGQEPPGTKFIAADEAMKTIVSDQDRDAFKRFLPLASTIFELNLFARSLSAAGASLFARSVEARFSRVRGTPNSPLRGSNSGDPQRTRENSAFALKYTNVSGSDSPAGTGGMGGRAVGSSFGLCPKDLKSRLRSPPIVTGLAQRMSHMREASVGITGPGCNTIGYKSPDPLSIRSGTNHRARLQYFHRAPLTRTERITEYCAELGVGIVEVAFGCTGIAAGTGISGTGVGAPVGVPVLAGSVVLTTAGIANCGNSIRHLTIELWRSDDSDASVPSSPPSESAPAAPAAPAPQPAKPAPTPAPAATTPAATPVQPAALKPYKDGAGHHVPAKRAFEGKSGYTKGYDPKKAPAIPKDELKALGVNHNKVTTAQRLAYIDFAKTGKPLTWEAIAKIETDALVKGEMTLEKARATVGKAIQALKDAGVVAPVRIPWGGN